MITIREHIKRRIEYVNLNISNAPEARVDELNELLVFVMGKEEEAIRAVRLAGIEDRKEIDKNTKEFNDHINKQINEVDKIGKE